MLSQWAYQMIGATSQWSALANEAKKKEKEICHFKTSPCSHNKLYPEFILWHVWMNFPPLASCLNRRAIILGGHWCLLIDYLKGCDLIALIYCDDVNRWLFFLGLFECFGGGEEPTSQHWITVFIHVVWKAARIYNFAQMFQLCS